MIYKNKIKNITLDKKGITLKYKEILQKEILYSELDEIYITVNKTKPFSVFILLMISLIAAVFSILVLQTNIILTLSLLIIFTVVLKMNTFKKYGLKICLKNGEIIETRIIAKSKHETIDTVNQIKKEIYNYKIEKSNEELLNYSL